MKVYILEIYDRSLKKMIIENVYSDFDLLYEQIYYYKHQGYSDDEIGYLEKELIGSLEAVS